MDISCYTQGVWLGYCQRVQRLEWIYYGQRLDHVRYVLTSIHVEDSSVHTELMPMTIISNPWTCDLMIRISGYFLLPRNLYKSLHVLICVEK
jgi:hypothetical protein